MTCYIFQGGSKNYTRKFKMKKCGASLIYIETAFVVHTSVSVYGYLKIYLRVLYERVISVCCRLVKAEITAISSSSRWRSGCKGRVRWTVRTCHICHILPPFEKRCRKNELMVLVHFCDIFFRTEGVIVSRILWKLLI